jgi:hypothetical protein
MRVYFSTGQAACVDLVLESLEFNNLRRIRFLLIGGFDLRKFRLKINSFSSGSKKS